MKLTLTLKKLLLLILFPIISVAQSDKNACRTLLQINKLIQENHYKPKPIDDSLSVYVFDSFLEKLDENTILFLAPEVDELKKNRLNIDDNIKKLNCGFLKEFYTSYSKSIDRFSRIIAEIKAEPFAFSSKDSIIFSNETFPYSKDEKELKYIYQKRVLFNVLRDISEVSTNKDSIIANFDKIAANSKNKIIESYECKTSDYTLSEKEFESLFFSTFCTYFDPHTDYFSPSEKSQFLSTVSSDNYSFGIQISLSDDNVLTVDEVITGSEAYKSEKISNGDTVVKVKVKEDEFTIACSSLKKIEEVFTSGEIKKAEFTFRKKSGEIYSIELSKELLKDFENNVYSMIIEKDGTKMGYIKIPSFYSTFEDGLSNVTDDVLEEISKLKNDKVTGLVLDLQNNGGGSMGEAIRLTQTFIKKGPIAIMADRERKFEVVKTAPVGVYYNEPIVVLVNGFSASASEFFTNAIQDYDRAIIVGSTTYGKASMQRIYPITYDNESFVKLTIEEFYRITGQTNQNIGIVPDVSIPTLFDKQVPREKTNVTAIENDFIKKNAKFKKFDFSNKQSILDKSQERLNTNSYIKEISNLNVEINKLYDDKFPNLKLNLDTVFNQVQKINSLWKQVEDFSKKELEIAIQSTSDDENLIQKDEFLLNLNKEKIKAIKQNAQIIEASNILFDILTTNSK